jgi:hypothetical protein
MIAFTGDSGAEAMLAIICALSVLSNVAVVGRWWVKQSSDRRPYKRIHDLILIVYLIRRRLQVSRLRIEVRREAVALRHDLMVELAELRRHEGGTL